MTFNLFFCFPQVSWQIVSIPTSHLLFFLQWLFLQQQHYFLFLFVTENQHSLRPFTIMILKNISTEQREKQASKNHFWIKTKNYHSETIIIIIILWLCFFPARQFVWLWGWDIYTINVLGVPGIDQNWSYWISGSASDMICWLLYRQQNYLPLFPCASLAICQGIGRCHNMMMSLSAPVMIIIHAFVRFLVTPVEHELVLS